MRSLVFVYNLTLPVEQFLLFCKGTTLFCFLWLPLLSFIVFLPVSSYGSIMSFSTDTSYYLFWCNPVLLQILLNYTSSVKTSTEKLFLTHICYLWLEGIVLPNLYVCAQFLFFFSPLFSLRFFSYIDYRRILGRVLCAQSSWKKWKRLSNYNLMAKYWVCYDIDFPFTLPLILRTALLLIPLIKP